jgi:hypothetical protein
MKRIITLAGVGLFGLGTLAACSDKVDRDGTKDQLVEQVEAAGGTVDESCVDDLFDGYSDKELKGFDDELKKAEPSEDAVAFVQELSACVTAGG